MKYKYFIHHFTFLATQWQENIEIIRFSLLILNFGDLRISKNQLFSNFSFFISPIRKIGTWQPMQIAKRASHRSDKTGWPQNNDTWKLRTWNRSGPGFGWWEIGNSACDWTIGYPRTLSSIPARRKKFTNARWVCPQQCKADRIPTTETQWNGFVLWSAREMLSRLPHDHRQAPVEIRTFLKRFLHLCVVFAVILAVRLSVVSPRVCRVAHCCFLKKKLFRPN